MHYDDLFTTENHKIENIINAAYTVIDSNIIVSVNQLLTDEFILPHREPSIKINKTTGKKKKYCLHFLYNWFYQDTQQKKVNHYSWLTPRIKVNPIIGDENENNRQISFNLLLFLHGLEIEELIMIAKYHNIYYKNRIIRHVLNNEKDVLKHKKNIINWIYDNIRVYMYSQQYML